MGIIFKYIINQFTVCAKDVTANFWLVFRSKSGSAMHNTNQIPYNSAKILYRLGSNRLANLRPLAVEPILNDTLSWLLILSCVILLHLDLHFGLLSLTNLLGGATHPTLVGCAGDERSGDGEESSHII